MRKIIVPISCATVLASSLMCVGCASNPQVSALQWNTLKDGDYKHFAPKGEYATPMKSTTPVLADTIWESYLGQQSITNMIGNDIIYNQLAIYITTTNVNLTITPLVICSNKDNKTISWAVNLCGKSEEIEMDISILVDNLHYDVRDNEYGIYFSTDWLINTESPYWSLDNWQIIIWMNGQKTTINSTKQEFDLTTAANWTAIKPYYCKDITLAK